MGNVVDLLGTVLECLLRLLSGGIGTCTVTNCMFSKRDAG